MSEQHTNAHAALVEAAETYLSNDMADDYWEDIIDSHGICGCDCDWCARAARVPAARRTLRAALAKGEGRTP
jgi:hypothetical protein